LDAGAEVQDDFSGYVDGGVWGYEVGGGGGGFIGLVLFAEGFLDDGAEGLVGGVVCWQPLFVVGGVGEEGGDGAGEQEEGVKQDAGDGLEAEPGLGAENIDYDQTQCGCGYTEPEGCDWQWCVPLKCDAGDEWW